MESKTSLSFMFVILLGFVLSSQAYDFYVGGKDGWVLKPSESYDHWAGRLRFRVNDTLVFKYKNGTDSVLVVNKKDYDTCNISSPVSKLDGGDSNLKFDRSGPFYFISGNQSNCQNGQKLIVVVLSPRTKYPPSGPSNPPSSPPTTAPSTSPVVAPSRPPGSAPSTSPVVAPTSPPGSAPSTSPVVAPTSPPGSAPSTPPVVAPTSPPGSAPSTPPVVAPTSPPGASQPPSGGDIPSAGGAPSAGGGGSGPSGQAQSPPGRSSSPALTSSMRFGFGVSLLVTVALGSFAGVF